MHAVAGRGQVLLASAEPGATFHPKVFLFSDAPAHNANAVAALKRASRALILIGSSNLTGGGLYANDEANLIWQSVLSNQDDSAAWESLIDKLAPWLDPTDPIVVGRATASRLRALARSGRLPRELALPGTRASRRLVATGRTQAHAGRRRIPTRPSLLGPAPPPPGPSGPSSPPGLPVLIARLVFGGSRRWPQWELNADVLASFFGVISAGDRITREAVTRAGVRHARRLNAARHRPEPQPPAGVSRAGRARGP
jgi:hypothetical protein